MKKWIKILLVIMLASYALAFTIVMEQGGMNFLDGGLVVGDQSGLSEASSKGQIQSVRLDEKVKNIRISSKEDDVVVQTVQTQSTELTVQVVGSSLANQVVNLTRQGDHVLIEVYENAPSAIIELSETKVIVKVPSSFSGELKVDTKSANIDVKATDAQILKMDSDSGDISIFGSASNQKIHVDTDSGDATVVLAKIEGYGFNLQTTSGEIKVPGSLKANGQEDSKELQSKSGSEGREVVVRTSSGNITVN